MKSDKETFGMLPDDVNIIVIIILNVIACL